jgi:hypothetical protein
MLQKVSLCSVEVHSQEYLPKKLPTFIANFHKLLLFIAKVDF